MTDRKQPLLPVVSESVIEHPTVMPIDVLEAVDLGEEFCEQIQQYLWLRDIFATEATKV